MRPKRLTYANVMSTIAVFVALGGTSYAVARNSIGTPQLKNNAVSTAKIKPGAVTSSRILDGAIQARDLAGSARSSGLRGPRGAIGPAGPPGSAGGALPGLEAWRGLDFVAGWTNYGSIWEGAGFRKDQLGVVHLRGLVTRASGLPGSGTTIALLPVGYRPPRALLFAVGMGEPATAGRVDVAPGGQVNWSTGPTGELDYTSLSGISFATDG